MKLDWSGKESGLRRKAIMLQKSRQIGSQVQRDASNNLSSQGETYKQNVIPPPPKKRKIIEVQEFPAWLSRNESE